MKVAIIGAGLAGLACAHELESYGIKPVLFERNDFVGEQHPHVSAILEITHRPEKDSVEYFNKLGLKIKPINAVNTIVHNSPHKITTLTGQFGYFFLRDKGPDDVKNQMFSQLKKTKLLLDRYGDYESLSREYDYVVVANGTINYTNELGVWKGWVNTYVKGAVVLGDFDPNTLVVWINKDYCKSGYAYLTPFSRNKASMALVVTEINEQEVSEYWELFLNTENLKYTIVQEFTLNHKSGYVYPHRVDNILLAGNAGGVIDPFLGFGQYGSITMGVLAARAIALEKDYEKLLKNITDTNLKLHEFRKAFDQVGNLGYDIIITSVGLPGLKHLIYDTKLNVIKYGSYFMRLIPKKLIKK